MKRAFVHRDHLAGGTRLVGPAEAIDLSRLMVEPDLAEIDRFLGR